ncbi:MAG: helix-turn-helix transcriptional regulator [Parvibaculaceae bacterium]|nr:helix-turn-helix transcriptional regulator [Parvibaculaceae bacterium]
MAWSGDFHFGGTFATYFGPSDDNDLHQHAAYQVVVSATGDARVLDHHGEMRCGRAFVIKPLVLHAVRSLEPLLLIYLDPQSRLAHDLQVDVGSADISPLSDDVLPFAPELNVDKVVDALGAVSKGPVEHIDPRLSDALEMLGKEPGSISVGGTAAHCGLSDSRLRALARQQLGVPLSTWLIWRKLERAANELALGGGLADAALAGGFSDQAHFTREMRRMFGVTPKVAAQSFR